MLLSEMSNTFFPICSLAISIFLFCIFFGKKYTKNKETKIYSWLVVCGLIESVTYVSLVFFVDYFYADYLFDIFALYNKVLCSIYIIWMSLFTFYLININKKVTDKGRKLATIILSSLALMFIAIIFALPIELYYDSVKMISNASGMAVDFLYLACSFYIVYIVIIIFMNVKRKTLNAKFTPVFMLLFLITVSLIIRKIDPFFNITSNVLSLVLLMMYHTIENPDVKMLETVELAKTQAEQANAAKTDFLSSMSHEIRTPLNAIVGFSECIVKADNLDSAKNDAKDIIMASQNLLEIVNGILDISKIESGKMELVNTEYDIVKMGENLTKLMKARMGEKPIEFQCKFGDDLPGVLYGDEGKIKQIITNILTNAIKYTEKGFINFEINCINEGTSCKLAISIEDTGRGIKPEKINSLFNKFERLDEDKNTTLEGTGLGLAITKRLVEMMKGKIIVQSKYGEGTKFTVYIVQQIRAMERRIVEESYNNNRIADFSGKKVMIVDDNKLNIKIASRLLAEYKVIIEECESGFECIDKINEGNNYDLILMDDMMPKLSGVETFKRLQLIEGFSIPVVALTANAIDGMREQYLEEGFNDYLSKPINKDELNRVLNAYLAMKIVNVDIFEPLPSSIYEITDEDIREIDELMPKSELEVPANEENANSEVEEIKTDNSNVTEEEKKEDLEPISTDEVNKDSNTQESETTKNSIVENSNNNETNKEDVVVVQVEEGKNILEVETPVLETTSNNKGSKEFLISNDIDVDAGLELLGDMEMYNETLQGFLNETTERIPKMEEYKNSNDMKNYAILAHAMKSDSKYLGFKKLAELSLNHELKGKEDDSNYVNENYEELMTEANRIINVVKEYMGV